jgi:membrane fusion protein, multidrug efflux system
MGNLRSLAALIVVLALSACSGGDEKRGGGPGRGGQPVPVRLTEARLESLPVQLKSLGTVMPLNNVAVRSRVDGELVGVSFEEGQMVKQGQLLAQIDPRPYEVSLAQATGAQTESRVQLQNAEMELKRLKDLLDKNYVSKQQLNNQEALVRQYRARLETADAAVASAQLQLDYTRIVAPIDGRLGLRKVDRGNLVRSSDPEGLVTIAQVQPINVVFTVPETEVSGLLDAYRAQPSLGVEAWDRSEQQRLAQGKLASLDNQIDTSTGTLRLKAAFANTDGKLFPNQFVNVRLAVRTIDQAIVIPDAAIQYGAQGNYVYVVKDAKVSIRPVKPGAADNDRLVILEGLAAGEQVVLEGFERLREGATVRVIGGDAATEDTAS